MSGRVNGEIKLGASGIIKDFQTTVEGYHELEVSCIKYWLVALENHSFSNSLSNHDLLPNIKPKRQ